jgi:hypothetical protein
MAGDGLSTQLREFLRPLKPEERAVLLSKLERGLLRGDDIPGCQLVVNELRRMIGQSDHLLPRVGNPPRLFFRTFEPFLVNDPDAHNQGNCIARASLMPLWTWISEKLMPTQAQSFCRLASAALLAGHADKAARLTRTFQDHVLKRMQETLAAARADDHTGRRIAFEMGTPGGLADLQRMIDILKARDALAALRALAEIERVIDKIKADPKDPAVGVMLKNIPSAARGLPIKLDVPSDSPWGRQLIAIRAELSDRLKMEIELLPERVRRLLRPRSSKDITAGSVLAEREIAEAEVLIEFARVCGAYATQLHIQEAIWQAFSDMRNDLKDAKQALLDELRMAGKAERNFRRSQVAAAVRICAKVIDEDYAAQFAKAAGLSPASVRAAANA